MCLSGGTQESVRVFVGGNGYLFLGLYSHEDGPKELSAATLYAYTKNCQQNLRFAQPQTKMYAALYFEGSLQVRVQNSADMQACERSGWKKPILLVITHTYIYRYTSTEDILLFQIYFQAD